MSELKANPYCRICNSLLPTGKMCFCDKCKREINNYKYSIYLDWMKRRHEWF